jgi:predicted transposase/invertase (TIGR01784 family)
MTTIKIDPKVDFVFRKLFGSDENKDLLISLINSVLEPEVPIVDVVIKNPFNLAEYDSDKESILDIKAVDQDGKWYDIEMQVQSHVLYGRRAVYYLAKTYTDQLESGDDYSKLNTTIGIHFLDFNYFDDERMVRQFILKDVDTHQASVELACLRLYFIEMRKFKKDWPELNTMLDRWVAFLNKAHLISKASLPEQLAQAPAVVKAVGELERIGLSREERVIYEGEVKKKMVDAIQLKTAKDQGLQQGIEQGMQQGMQRLVTQLMVRRMGEVPPTVSARLQDLNIETLSKLGLDLLDFTSYDDVERWLTRH